VTVHDSVLDAIGHTPLVRLRRLFPPPLPATLAKLELLNPGGSVKDRPARFMIEQALESGAIDRDTHLVESSSGNLGVAVAMVAKAHGLEFTCVVDPKACPANVDLIRRLGANIVRVTEPDDHGGYLKSRLERVGELLDEMPNAYWINQYGNDLNWQAHYRWTAQEILDDLDAPVDHLVLAVSTTGTAMGIGRRLREAFPGLRVVAVDAHGSAIFGDEPAPRELPGLGSSIVPDLLDPHEVDEVVHVTDAEATQGCLDLVETEGIFAGGSSGAVVAALRRLLPDLSPASRVVTILPDRGERYLDTVYSADWQARVGAERMVAVG
jgi:N-(2-amino-2-carboxyethyl)-L-glutamate synthase